YSLYLKDKNVFQLVLNEALRTLKEDCNCHCEKTEGACPDCLSSRETFMFDSKLSKRKALEWLTAQALAQTPVPIEILTKSPNAKFSLLPLYQAIAKAVENPETKGITLVMSDYPAAPSFTEAFDGSSPLGMLVLKARQRQIPVRLLVEFHPELYSSELDVMPFSNIENLLPEGEVKLVEDFGHLKPIAMVETDSIRQKFITPSVDALEISKDWGSQEYPIFIDDNSIDYHCLELPRFNANSSDVILEGITDVTEAMSSSYFKSVIAPAVGFTSLHQESIEQALRGKGVKIELSDPYMISPLSMVMTIDLVEEICRLFGCHPVKVEVSNTGRATRFGKLNLNSYSRVNDNFTNQDDADDFMDELCSERLNIEPTFIEETTAHYRYLRMETSDGVILEIRPDHGFAGGWKSFLTLGNIQSGRDLKFERSNLQSNDILYYLLFRKGQ
ncbi:MAG: hypothetical protein K2G23_05015, partial [Muribaculaceae bacterium]|nr:hypothetical protein [Muribaculaceae bacterium]